MFKHSSLVVFTLMFGLGLIVPAFAQTNQQAQGTQVADPVPATPTATTDDELSEADLAIVEGEGISIVGSQDLNQQVKTIKRADIEKSNSQDLPSLLQKTLGLNIKTNGAYGNESSVNIRGLGGERVAILINGVPVAGTPDGKLDLGKIDLASIEKIEVIYGGSDTKYNVNGAEGGVINIITVGRHFQGFKAGWEISNISQYPGAVSELSDLIDTQSAGLNLAVGNEFLDWSLRLRGTRAANNFLFEDNSQNILRRTGNDIWDAGASTSISLLLSDSATLMITGDGYYGYKNIPGAIGSTATGLQKDMLMKASAFLDVDKIGGSNFSTELIGSYGFDSKDWSTSNYQSKHDSNTFNFVNRWNWVPNEWVTLLAGIDFDAALISSDTLGEKQVFNGGIFSTAEFAIDRNLKIIPSLKGVLAGNEITPVPKLGIVYTSETGLTVKNNYWRAYRLPTLNDLFWPYQDFGPGYEYEGNQNLKPEDGFGEDLIMNYLIKNIASLEIALHGTYLNNAINWAQDSGGVWRPSNVDSALFFGSDTTVKSEFDKHLSLSAGYSFLMTYVLGAYNFSDNKRWRYAPMHIVRLGAEYGWETGSVSATGHFEGERYTTNSNTTSLTPFFTLDVTFNQQLGDTMTLFVNVKNALNERYFLTDGYPMPGGSVTVGVKAQYDSK